MTDPAQHGVQTKLHQLAVLQNKHWGQERRPRQQHQTIATAATERSQPPGTGPTQTNNVEPLNASAWVAYSLLRRDTDVAATPRRRDAMWDFLYQEAVAIGQALLIRFRWAPDNNDHEYLLLIPFAAPDVVDLDGGATEVLEQITFRVVHKADWKTGLVAVTPRLSLLLPTMSLDA